MPAQYVGSIVETMTSMSGLLADTEDKSIVKLLGFTET